MWYNPLYEYNKLKVYNTYRRALPFELPIIINKPNTKITIYGHVPEDSDGFIVDLTEKRFDNSKDFVLHVNPTFKKHQIVFNSAKNGVWYLQQIREDNPLKRGSQFKMDIFVDEDGFDIYVNNKKLYKYTHVLSYKNINVLQFKGNVKLFKVIMPQIIKSSGMYKK